MTSIRPIKERRWHVDIGLGRVQSAIADGTEEAFRRALRPGRLLPVSMVAGIVAIVAVGAAGVTTAHAEAQRAAPAASDPPPASGPNDAREIFRPERHVGPIDPELLERLRQSEMGETIQSADSARVHHRRRRSKDPLQLTR